MSLLLALKLLAAPALIGLASLAGKRWGPNAAGLLGGLPLVGGPVVLVLWISQGAELATAVAQSAPVGVWATLSYLLTFGYVSARCRWPLSLALSWAVYLFVALLLNESGLAHNWALGLAVLPGLWLAVTRLLPRPQFAVMPSSLPPIELLARMAAAVVLVFVLTSAAEQLGPQLTGVLAGAPVAATVIPSFTLATAGRDALLLTLRGFLTGLVGFALFFLLLAYALPKAGAWAIVPAVTSALLGGLLASRALREIFAAPVNRSLKQA